MKVEPSKQPVIRTDPPMAKSRASFVALLGSPAPVVGVPISEAPSVERAPQPSPSDEGREKGEVAVAFSALGMFGLRAETAQAGGASVARPEAALPVPMEAAPAFTPVAAQTVVVAGLSSDATPSGQTVRSLVRFEARPVGGKPMLGGNSAVADVHSAQETLVVKEVDAAPVAGRRRAVQTATGTEARAHLTLSDTANAAGLAVRLAGLSVEEVAQFRARARNLLGEHGLRLDKLDINGEDRFGDDLPTWGRIQWR
jgi:hypothetical protein